MEDTNILHNTSSIDKITSFSFDGRTSRQLSVLMTGHCGYIGSALVQFLKKLPYIKQIVGYDIIDGNDILDETKLSRFIRSYNVDLVIHLAALSSVSACAEDPLLAIKVNADGTYSVLNAMKTAGCENIIYASTSSVYGDSDHSPYLEEQCLDPCSPYGISKLLGEYAIFNHYSLKKSPGNYLIFRMFNVVGSSGFAEIDSSSNPGYDRLFAALQSGKMTVYGKDYDTFDGTCERDYISLKDVCNAYIKGIETMLLGSKNESCLNQSIKHSETCNLWDFGRDLLASGYFTRLNVGNIMAGNMLFDDDFEKIIEYSDRPNTVRMTINICSGEPSSVKSMIRQWNIISSNIKNKKSGYEKCNQLPHVSYVYGDRRPGDPSKVYGSNERAARLMGWVAERKINDIILDLALDKKL